MLFAIIFLCALIGACIRTPGNPLWVLVLYFLEYYVIFFVVAVGFLIAICKTVDLDREPEKDSKFYRFFMYLYIDALITLVGVKVRTRGMEKLPQDSRFLLVCNHQHMADPGILLSRMKKSGLTFISKQEVRTMPIIGSFLVKIRGQFLDRNDDRQALRLILNCIRMIQNDEASIGVFPEGTRTRDGKVHDFRPGVFKIAQKANVPIVVCTINGTGPIFHNLKKFRRTPVELHLVEVIPAEELKGQTTRQIADRVYEMMISDLGESFRAVEG